jgi:hypothetical protein
MAAGTGYDVNDRCATTNDIPSWGPGSSTWVAKPVSRLSRIRGVHQRHIGPKRGHFAPEVRLYDEI